MPEILEGRFHPMPSDPAEIRTANKTIFLLFMVLATLYPAGHLAFLFGGWIGHILIGQ